MHLIVRCRTCISVGVRIRVGVHGSGVARESSMRVAAHLPTNAAADARAVATAAHSFALGLADDCSPHAFAHSGANIGASSNQATHIRCNAAGTRQSDRGSAEDSVLQLCR